MAVRPHAQQPAATHDTGNTTVTKSIPVTDFIERLAYYQELVSRKPESLTGAERQQQAQFLAFLKDQQAQQDAWTARKAPSTQKALADAPPTRPPRPKPPLRKPPTPVEKPITAFAPTNKPPVLPPPLPPNKPSVQLHTGPAPRRPSTALTLTNPVPPVPPRKPKAHTSKPAAALAITDQPPPVPPRLPPSKSPISPPVRPAAPPPPANFIKTAATIDALPPTEARQELSLPQLYGPNLKDVVINQKGGNTCYLLASLDSILHMPPKKARQVLSRIKIYKIGNSHVEVKFPGQPNAITLHKSEIRDSSGVESKVGIQIIEAAYLKIPGVRRGYFDESANALIRIFGEDNLAPITIQNSKSVSRELIGKESEVTDRGLRKTRDFDHHIGQIGFYHEERGHQFKMFIAHAKAHPEADILTAIRIGTQQTVHDETRGVSFKAPTGGHYYSIRLYESTPEQIVLANPYDTADSIQVPFDEFMRGYNIEGMRLNLHE